MVTNHDDGGYNMSDSAIGIFLTITAVFQLTYQVTLVMSFDHMLHHVISLYHVIAHYRCSSIIGWPNY